MSSLRVLATPDQIARLSLTNDISKTPSIPKQAEVRAQLTFATSFVGTGANSFGCHEYPIGFLTYQAASGWKKVGCAPKNCRYG